MQKKQMISSILCLNTVLFLLTAPGCQVKTANEPKVEAVTPSQPRLLSWRVASAWLEDIFAQIPNSSIEDFRKDTPAEERRLVNAAHGETGIRDDNAHVYGEPAPLSTDFMLKRMGAGDQDVLYDLGCGRGFFLMQALLTTPIRKAVGVELAASRINIGRRARQMLLDQGLLAPGRELDLREEDMAKTNMDDATLVYMDSVFYSDQLLDTVIRTMARARSLRMVVMIQKGLPANPYFELERTERLKMSWSPRFGTDVLFYKRTAVPAE